MGNWTLCELGSTRRSMRAHVWRLHSSRIVALVVVCACGARNRKTSSIFLSIKTFSSGEGMYVWAVRTRPDGGSPDGELFIRQIQLTCTLQVKQKIERSASEAEESKNGYQDMDAGSLGIAVWESTGRGNTMKSEP